MTTNPTIPASSIRKLSIVDIFSPLGSPLLNILPLQIKLLRHLLHLPLMLLHQLPLHLGHILPNLFRLVFIEF